MALLTVISRRGGSYAAALWVGRTLVTRAPATDWETLLGQLNEAGVLPITEALVPVFSSDGRQLRKLSLALDEPRQRPTERARDSKQRW